MELLLNLCWLLLAVPAFWMWRRQPLSVRQTRPLVCLLALACALVLLFPIISESDDLHAMRQEFEESSTKVKAGESDKSSQISAKLHVAPALVTSSTSIRPGEIMLGLVDAYVPYHLLVQSSSRTRDRAPPISLP